MSKSLSVITSIEKGSISSSQPFLVCLDIDVIDPATGLIVETLYLIRNTQNITYNGHTYTAAAFDISFKSEAGTLPSVSVTIQDHSRAVQARMQAYNGGMGFTVKLTVINYGDLTQPPEIVEYFEITHASASDYTAQFTLGAENVLAAPFPRRRQTKRFCQFRYKGDSCGYRDLQRLVSPGTAGNYVSTPDSVNLIPSQNWITYSEDLTAWTDISTVTVTANAHYDPDGNLTMDTLTDDSAAAYEGKSLNFTVGNDAGVYQVACLVRKDLGATHRAGINFGLSGGTPVNVNARFALDGTNASGCTVTSYDDYHWLVSASITNNTSGNVTLNVSLYPATAATKSGGDNVAGIGSTTFGRIRLQYAARLLPYFKTTGTANKGQIEIEIDLAATDWSPVAYQEIVSKMTNGCEYLVRLNIAGSIGMMWGSDAATLITATSNANLSALAASSRKKIKITAEATVGANREVKFYTSDDGITWTQLGTTVTSTATRMYAGTATLNVAFRTGGAGLFAGDIYSVIIRPVIGGSVSAKFDARDITVGALSGVSSVTGELWTVATAGSPAANIAYDAGYPKTSCDLTLQGDNGCEFHQNSKNFGGFPGLNNSNNKYA